MVARVLAWRLLGLAATLLGVAVLAWLGHGGLGAALRGAAAAGKAAHTAARTAVPLRAPRLHGGQPWVVVASATALLLAPCAAALGLRWRARRRRRYVRLQVETYRTDRASVEGLVAAYEALHKRLQRRWWRRAVGGQPSVALEVHHARGAGGASRVRLAVVCPVGLERMVEAALRSAYPNCRVAPVEDALSSLAGGAPSPGRRELAGDGWSAGQRKPARDGWPAARGEPAQDGWPAGLDRSAAVVRLRKHATFIKRVKRLDPYELAREPPMDRLMTVMGACGQDAVVQLALTPAPATLERYAKWRYKRHEDHLARERREHLFVRDRSLVEEAELRGGLAVQHRPLYYADVRVVTPTRRACEQIASELRAEGAENRLVERGTAVRHGLAGTYRRRVLRGEGNPWPAVRKGVWASTELAALWHAPSVDYATVPFARSALPLAPAPPAIARPCEGPGLLRDAYGPVSIHPAMRRQNTAVPGTVDQGKSSYLAATVAEDVRRERCAVIVLDPKGDAAEAAVSLVPPERTCTLLDCAHPTCGFNPLAVDVPADTIADYVVGALRGLFTDADIRASSDRYLRNAIIAVLAHDRRATLWDAARLLSVGAEGYAYRARVGAHVRTKPEYKEIAEFFTAELSAQLADSRSTTTAKLDAPVNKLARLLNSPSIKRVLLNESLAVDLDRVIAHGEVLVVKGALGAMGAGNTAVVMQLLVGMLDAALARQQDSVPPERRMAVALKVDEAPMVLNRNFAETLALKRSAGLETVACWQTDAQWTDREVRAQLDALFAHRVYFATASAEDARAAARLAMAEYSDTVRPEISGLTALGRPDARLHLPRHHAIVSWVTPEGRQAPFVASTVPLRVDAARLEWHAARQAARGGRYLADLSQPHWERRDSAPGPAPTDRSRETRASDKNPQRAQAGRGEAWGRVRAGAHGGKAVGRGASVPHDRGATGRGTPARREGRDAAEHGIPASRESVDAAARGAPASCEGVDAAVRGTSAPREGVDAATRGTLAPREGVDAAARGRPAARVGGEAQADTLAPLPAAVAASYAELVDLDAAHTMRWARAGGHAALDPDELDLEILVLVAGVRHVLTTQVHRRFNPERALTTTQRRLKRLSDAGWVERFQFHRRDGGGAPMCYVLAARGAEVLRAHGLPGGAAHGLPGGAGEGPASRRERPADDSRLRRASHDVHSPAPAPLSASRSSSLPVAGDGRLRRARHDVHVSGWALALERALGGRVLRVKGPEEAVLSPPLRSTPAGCVAIGPGELRLPGGRAPHDFLRTDAAGARVPVERFETVRPDVCLEVPGAAGGRAAPATLCEHAGGPGGGRAAPATLCEHAGGPGGGRAAPATPAAGEPGAVPGVCLMVERDDRLASRHPQPAVAKLERYDHLLAGWAVSVSAFTRRGAPRPAVVFLCRDRPRARECARRADHVLCACRAYAGEHPWEWEYPGRAAVAFAAERDVHEGVLHAYGVPLEPPHVRAARPGADPHAREATCEVRELLPAAGR